MGYVKKCFSLYFSFAGRASRKEFWSFVFFIFLIAIGLGFAEILIAPDIALFSPLGSTPLTLWFILCFMPMLSVSARRLHDIDFSAWWLLLILFPPFHIILILFYLLPGSNRVNTYGQEPKALNLTY